MTNMSKPTRYELRVTDEGAGLYATDAPNKNGMQYVMASAYDTLEARMAAQPPIGWRVIPFSGSWKRRDERWEVYSPEGSGGAVEASEILNADVAALLDSMTFARPLQARLVEALRESERFIAGFEGCELQEGIDALLAKIRAALVALGALK